MTRLIIEYVLNGHHRGYNFTSDTNGFDEEALRTIWRNVMPRGNGWSSSRYIGAISLKCFPLPDDRLAVAEVTVTNMEDENGRKGIRQAAIDIMTRQVFQHHIHSRLASYPDAVTVAAKRWHKDVSRRMPKLKASQPLLLSYPFTSRHAWWSVECLILMLHSQPPRRLKHHTMPISFTTLALDYRGESQIVALPVDSAQMIDDIPVVELKKDSP